MIKHLIFTGDTHGGVTTISRVGNIQRNMPEYKPEETMVVILGDAGLNFYLNNTDNKHKKFAESHKVTNKRECNCPVFFVRSTNICKLT